MIQTSADLKHLIFGNGEISLYHTNEILIPTNTLVVFMEAFRSSVDIDDLWHALGKIEGKFLYKTFEHSNENTLEKLMRFIELIGLGHYEILLKSDKLHSYLFKTELAPVAVQHIKCGIRAQRTEMYTAGIIAGYLQAQEGVHLSGNETHALVRHSPHTILEVKQSEVSPTETELRQIISNKDFCYRADVTPSYNNIIQKVLTQNHLTLTHGEIKLWNFSTTFIPIATLILCEEYLAKTLGQDAHQFFYFIGKKQAYAASQIQIRQYGRANDYKLFLSMFEHHDLIGCGKGSVLKFEEERRDVHLRSENNTYLKYYHDLFGEVRRMNWYLAGLTGGITTAYFGTEIQSEEKSISKDACTFELYEEKRAYPPLIEKITRDSLTVRGFLS